ncbi:MAG: hypothetical protein KKB30_13485 [Proteobacteria bacterium]|nr:hypothetical protein [Pseudomonadota bacterium]MBU1717362.1 hypothetical protein [Pseudomonadota bacterium]
MKNERCLQVTHHARNGVQALMGQMLILRDRLDCLGILDQVDLTTIDQQIQRVGDAVDNCRPTYQNLND